MFLHLFYMLFGWYLTTIQPTGIQGTITPFDGVRSMQLVSSKDTIRTYQLEGKYFRIEARPGTYYLYIETTSEYKPFIAQNLIVEPGKMTDVGDLVLQKMIRKLEYAPYSHSRSR